MGSEASNDRTPANKVHNWTELSAVAIAIFAFVATAWQAWIARDAEKRSLRAYVSYDDPLVTPVTDTNGVIAEWKLSPEWVNHCSTPTRGLTSSIQCVTVRKDTYAIVLASSATLSPLEIAPTRKEYSGICSVTTSDIESRLKIGITNGIKSSVDYCDVFGERHHSEQCVTIDFNGDPKHNLKSQRSINFCGRNCEDEECERIVSSAPPHNPPH